MSFMMVADEGQMEDSWRVARTAAGTSARGTSENPMVEKNDVALVVARKTSPSTSLSVASTMARPTP
ncbi:hypothetical protein [Endobacterium cereale]|uniref:hypothetical protein n=1 Tax=Endobacterium cereale TaxID=2663029 RepID=UPI001F47D51E|nr:hypothetical protein [Endobacterium cereale]